MEARANPILQASGICIGKEITLAQLFGETFAYFIALFAEYFWAEQQGTKTDAEKLHRPQSNFWVTDPSSSCSLSFFCGIIICLDNIAPEPPLFPLPSIPPSVFVPSVQQGGENLPSILFFQPPPLFCCGLLREKSTVSFAKGYYYMIFCEIHLHIEKMFWMNYGLFGDFSVCIFWDIGGGRVSGGEGGGRRGMG